MRQLSNGFRLSCRICLMPDERSERKMTPRNDDIFADLNPEFFDSVVFPVKKLISDGFDLA